MSVDLGGIEPSQVQSWWPHYSVGLHPWSADHWNEQVGKQLVNLAETPRCLAIGECGLDMLKGPAPDIQQSAFRFQCEMSKAIGKPLIVHCVKAFDRLLQLRKEFAPCPPWIIHGFRSSREVMQSLGAHGCVVSFGPNLFKNPGRTFELMTGAREFGYFLETDTSSWDIESVYASAAELSRQGIETVQDQVRSTFSRIFQI